MDIIGKVLIKYIRDRVIKYKLTADCLFYGPGGIERPLQERSRSHWN